MDREEVYHRMHALMWSDRLRGDERFEAAVEELWPYALGVLAPEQRAAFAERVGRDEVDAVERGGHSDELRELLDEMTMVRRSVPGATW
jgi:1,2-phenylacetyl-CoA epoxidase catalytic subunit